MKTESPSLVERVRQFVVAYITHKSQDPANIHCPVCGYYCLGKGGIGCIDKPSLCESKK